MTTLHLSATLGAHTAWLVVTHDKCVGYGIGGNLPEIAADAVNAAARSLERGNLPQAVSRLEAAGFEVEGEEGQ